MVNCCNHTANDNSCIRSSDNKIFKLPRKFSRGSCKNPKGFTMRSSCAPYKDCFNKKIKKRKQSIKQRKKQKGGKENSSRILVNHDNLETAYFSGGCFWGIQEHFNKVLGVKNTFVGYMGGNIKNPNYNQVCNDNTGHAETIKITYDPKIISYSYLLNEFNKVRVKNITNTLSQYRSIIFTTDKHQKDEAVKFIKDNPDVELLLKEKYPFYKAENYHQNYNKNHRNGGGVVRKLPKLRKIDDSHKKHKYHLSDPQKRRILAINEGINYEMKHRGLTKKKAAISKKGRFNILRIYRKNNKKDECRKLTDDMKYIDKKYNLGTTKNICKGGGKRSSKRSSQSGKRSSQSGKRSSKRSSQSGKRSSKHKTKKRFLYNPDDPKRSFDVYIDKNPNDTIPIKYTTLNDVKSTIKKLEVLYKNDKYTHKRIWQVGMILYVRLKVLKDKKPNEFKLAERYFKHLGERTKIKDDKMRKKFIFKFDKY